MADRLGQGTAVATAATRATLTGGEALARVLRASGVTDLFGVQLDRETAEGVLLTGAAAPDMAWLEG